MNEALKELVENIVKIENDADFAARAGDRIIEALQLKPMGYDKTRFDTKWGDKTNVGIARTVLRFLLEEK